MSSPVTASQPAKPRTVSILSCYLQHKSPATQAASFWHLAPVLEHGEVQAYNSHTYDSMYRINRCMSVYDPDHTAVNHYTSAKTTPGVLSHLAVLTAGTLTLNVPFMFPCAH